jgi:regulatory protein
MKPMSLKMRAISLLSQRDHSVMELRRKLLRAAQESRRKAALAAQAAPGEGKRSDHAAEPVPEADLALEVDTLLVWLQAQGYLDEARFVESRVHTRSQRFGSLRIKQELAQHGLALSADGQAALKATELDRAQALWQRKFRGVAAATLAEQAKQSRFLIARGFAPDVIRRILRASADADSGLA